MCSLRSLNSHPGTTELTRYFSASFGAWAQPRTSAVAISAKIEVIGPVWNFGGNKGVNMKIHVGEVDFPGLEGGGG